MFYSSHLLPVFALPGWRPLVADVFHVPDCCYVIYSEIKDALVKNAFSGDVTYEGSDAVGMLLKCFDGVGVGGVLLGHSLALVS